MSNARRLIAATILSASFSAFICTTSQGGDKRGMTCPLTFRGTASGGSLSLGTLRGLPRSRFISVETTAGESAESVVQRLAGKIRAIQEANDLSDPGLLWVGAPPTTSGPTLELVGTMSAYFLAGTETGLGIPEPPVFLTCVYDEAVDGVRIFWENAPGGYDQIFITVRCGHGIHALQRSVPGNKTSYVIHRESTVVDTNDLYVAVVGFRHGVLSAPATMHVNKHYQDEACAIPFAGGIMPNWLPWCLSRTGGHKAVGREFARSSNCRKAFRCVQETSDTSYYAQDGLDAKPFYQAIRADVSGFTGVYRKFLGLTPGHTYRITGAISTLDMQGGNWVLSLSAAASEPGAKNLLPEQLAGIAPLPNGKVGRQAGHVASIERGRKITGRGFRIVQSDSGNQEPNEEGTDVTLPPGVDTLSVWIRFECPDPNGEVGLMGIGLEDITAARQNQVVPEEEPDKSRSGTKPDTQGRS